MRRKLIQFFLCLGIAAILPAAKSALAGDSKYGFGFRFEITPAGSTKEYVAAVIKPQMSTDDPAARALVDHAYRWVIERFKKAFPDLEPSKFDQMLATDTPLDGHSFTVVIYEKGHPEKIQANMRMVFPKNSEFPANPLEKNLNWKFPRPTPHRGDYPIPSLYGQSTEQLWQGNFVELKNLAVAEGAEQDFVPILFALAEEEASWNYAAQSALIDMKIKSGSISANRVPLELTAPSNYGIYCDERMVNHYQQKFGFKPWSAGPIKNRDYVMGVDREQFVEMVSRVKKRPGGALLNGEVIRLIQTTEKLENERKLVLQVLASRKGCLLNNLKNMISQ